MSKSVLIVDDSVLMRAALKRTIEMVDVGLDQTFDEPPWPFAESPLRPIGGTEQICHEREVAAVDALEQQRRPPGRDDTAMDLRHLEPGIHRSLDYPQLTRTPQRIQKSSEIGESRHGSVP